MENVTSDWEASNAQMCDCNFLAAKICIKKETQPAHAVREIMPLEKQVLPEEQQHHSKHVFHDAV